MYTGNLKANSYGKINKPVTGALRLLNFPWFFEKMKLKRPWMKGELDSKILVNRPDKQVVLTTIYEDTKIDSFQSDASVTLLVIGGKLKLHTRKESIMLKEGQLLKLQDKMNYSFTTRNETVFLLTIVNERKCQKFK